MPDTPEEYNENDPFEVPPVESDAGANQKDRCDYKAPAKSPEQCAVPVGANHPREMMSHCAERGHKNVDVLCTPAGLCEGEHRHEQKRRGDVKNQVPPAVQDPDVRFWRTRRNCRYGLRTGKGGNVLHRLERIESLNREKKSTSLSLSATGPYVHGGVAIIQTKFRRASRHHCLPSKIFRQMSVESGRHDRNRDVIRESWHLVCSPAVRLCKRCEHFLVNFWLHEICFCRIAAAIGAFLCNLAF